MLVGHAGWSLPWTDEWWQPLQKEAGNDCKELQWDVLSMDFKIEHTWDGLPICHEPVWIGLRPGDGGLMMEVKAPFFNDPSAPPGEAGKPFEGLWHYEVVEAFFLNDRTKQYLEVELCPHGQHLVILLSGRRHSWKQELPLAFEVSRSETTWEGKALLPWNYFPPGVEKFNLYAIHGSKAGRTYEALYPIPQDEIQKGQEPDFHRLEYFKSFSLNMIFGKDWKQPESDLWMSQKSIAKEEIVLLTNGVSSDLTERRRKRKVC
uniref:Chromosome 4 open reading frame 33 n=1 Tax=Monodelphis domestica TaxID=13616 RepID=F6ZYV0_MONDO